MSHGPHTTYPTYDERQILFDGCDECSFRGKNPDLAIAHMDNATFKKAWDRAEAWNNDKKVGYISDAEINTLRVLRVVRCVMTRMDLMEMGS